MKTKLNSKRIYLRKLKYSDAHDIYKNIKHKEIVKWTLNIPHPYPKKAAIKFIRKTHYRLKKKKGYAFGIILKEHDKLIGMVDVFRVDWKNKNAKVGYWLGKNYWNQGLTTEAVNLILNFAFKKLKLHRVYAGLFENNPSSKRVLEKCGFKLEGRLRESRIKHKKWQNELRYGLLAKEYLK